MVEHAKPQKTTQGGGALHTISRAPRHGWPLPRAPAREPALRPPLPPRPVPTVAPTTRPSPRLILKHGNSRQRSVPHDGRHHGPSHPSRSGTPHGPGATTTKHRETTAPVGETRHTRPQARGRKRSRPRQGATTPHHETHGSAPSHPGGKKYFIVEGLTDHVITLAANTLAATTDAWDFAMGRPTARKDRVQDTEDTLTPDLVNHLVTLTSAPEQHDRKTEGPKVTDWAPFIDRPPDTPTVTLTCHQHTMWVAQWNATGTTDRVNTFTPEAKPATPLALADRFQHSTDHPNYPRAHWLALKTAIHWTVDPPDTGTTQPQTWLTLTCNLTAYVRRQGRAQAQRWMSWPTDTERTLKLRTASLQEHANQLRGMHRPQEGHGPAYSIIRCHATKPAPKLAPERPQPKPRPRPGAADPSA